MTTWYVATMDGGIAYIAPTKRECVSRYIETSVTTPLIVKRIRAGLYEYTAETEPGARAPQWWVGTAREMGYEGWRV